MAHVNQDRSILTFALFNTVTLGIYGLFFMHKLAKDVNVLCKDDGKKTYGLRLIIPLSLVTCGLYSMIWYVFTAKRLHENAPRYDADVPYSGFDVFQAFFLCLFCLPILIYLPMFRVIENANALAAAYNQKNEEEALQTA